MARRQLNTVCQIAGLELNTLRLADTLGEEFERVRVPASGTPIYDINGTLLFHRLALRRGRTAIAYADVAAEPSLGEPLLGVSRGFAWDEKALTNRGCRRRAAKKGRRGLKYNAARLRRLQL